MTQLRHVTLGELLRRNHPLPPVPAAMQYAPPIEGGLHNNLRVQGTTQANAEHSPTRIA